MSPVTVERGEGRFESRNVAGGVQPIQTAVKKLAAVDTAGGLFAWANPTGKRIHVLGVRLDVTTASSGACTVDVGVAANGITLNDTIIDGVSVAATGVKDDQKDAGTNGAGVAAATSSQYVTGSVASGASAGIAGYAYIDYQEAFPA